eukprot:gene4042-55275_t
MTHSVQSSPHRAPRCTVPTGPPPSFDDSRGPNGSIYGFGTVPVPEQCHHVWTRFRSLVGVCTAFERSAKELLSSVVRLREPDNTVLGEVMQAVEEEERAKFEEQRALWEEEKEKAASY